MSLTKHPKPKTEFFFIADSKTCRIFWGFEQLSQHNWQRSYAISKTHENCLILAETIPTAKVLITVVVCETSLKPINPLEMSEQRLW